MFNNQNKNNNPFEVGSKQQSNVNQKQVSQQREVNESTQPQRGATVDYSKLAKKKNKKPKIIIGVIVAFFMVFILSDLEYYFYDFIYAIEEKKELASQEKYIVEDYQYDFSDFHSELDQDPFPEKMPLGKEFTITKDHEKYIDRADSTEMTLIVGEDIEPGLYTISYAAEDFINIDLRFDVFNPYAKTDYYNIPLVAGDKIESRYYDFSDDFTTVFKPQTEYVEFQEGYSGIFAYGRSNFNSQIEVQKGEYSSINYNYYSQESEYMRSKYYYDENVTLNGIPGSYFIIEYDDGTDELLGDDY